MTSPHPDKRYGSNIPENALDNPLVCVTMTVPDTTEYRAAIRGRLSWLTDWRAWSHRRRDYANPPSLNREIASLFTEAMDTLTFEECMDICLQIAECIADNPATQSALQDWLDNVAILPNQNPLDTPFTTINEQIPPDEWEKNIAPDVCTHDILFGEIRNAVQQMHRANIDALEIFVAESNLRKHVGNLIEAVPLLGELPIDDIIEYTALIVDFLKSNYESAYTGTLEDSIVCDLYCIADPTCDFSIDTAYEYFKLKVVPVAPDVQQVVSLLTLIVALSSLTASAYPPPGRIVVDLMMFAQLGLIRYANQAIGGMTFKRLNNLFAYGAGFPDDDWRIICDQCNNAELNDMWRFNFLEFDQFRSQANWAYASGIFHGDYTDTARRRRLLINLGTLSPALNIVSVRANRNYVRGIYDASVTAEVLTVNGVDNGAVSFANMPLNETQIDRVYPVVNSAVSSITYNLQSSRQPLASGSALSGSASLNWLDIEFAGQRPEWAVGKGYPVDALCAAYVFQNSPYENEWENISETQNNPSGTFGTWVSGQGLKTSVATLPGIYNQYPNQMSFLLKSTVPFRFYGLNLTYSGQIGVAGVGTTNNLWSVSASLAGTRVYTTGNIALQTVSSLKLVRYTDVLVDTIQLYAVAGNHPTRATTLANPGFWFAQSLLLRLKGNPSFSYEIC